VRAADERVLVIVLDGVDIGLVDRYLAHGQLPALRSLRDRSARFLLEHGAAARTGLAGEHFVSGLTPEAAGRSSVVVVDPATYDVWQERAKFEPFFARLDTRCVVFDTTYTDLDRAPEAVGLVAWGAHDPGTTTTAHPADLLDEIPPYPSAEWMYAVPWNSVESTCAMGDGLVEAVATRSRVARRLLAERFADWELAIVSTGEAHSAAEAFWHGVDPTHPLHAIPSAPAAAEQLAHVYREVDRLVADLVATAGPARVVAFSMGGMGPNESDVACMVLLPELLFRWACHDTRLDVPRAWSDHPRDIALLPDDVSWEAASEGWYPAPEPTSRSVVRALRSRVERRLRASRRAGASPGRVPPGALSIAWQPAARYRDMWPHMAAFAVPSYYDGRIRVNLRGREQRGRVEPDDYPRVLDELEALVRACRDPCTGEPVVASVERATGDTGSLPGTEADLTVVWNTGVCAFEHPDHGLIGPVPYRRTGGHTGPYGFAWIAGDGVDADDHGVRSAFDVTPTVVDLVGAPPLDGVCGQSLLSAAEGLR
jgi:predicted AlkP superfamily phosphohydrolase/phosphomutase